LKSIQNPSDWRALARKTARCSELSHKVDHIAISEAVGHPDEIGVSWLRKSRAIQPLMIVCPVAPSPVHIPRHELLLGNSKVGGGEEAIA